MMWGTLLGLLWLVLFSEGIADHLFQPGEEYSYEYRAIVQNGMIHPHHTASQWQLSCSLKVQGNINETVVKLSNCTVFLYNGHISAEEENDLNEIPLQEEAKDLENPFIIHYNEGYAQSIGTVSHEPLWAVNMKRALASILQIDLSKLQGTIANTMENTLHGKNLVDYIIINGENEVTVRKFIDHQNPLFPTEFPSVSWLNTPPMPCTKQSQMTTSSSEWIYSLEKTETGHYRTTRIRATGGINVQPFPPEGEFQYILVNQTFDLKSVSPNISPLKITTEVEIHGLKFEISHSDLTQGRDKLTKERILRNLNILLEKLSESLEKNPGKLTLNELHQDNVPDILYLLSLLDEDGLENYYSQLAIGTSYQQETQRNFLLELLPKVGTKSSVLFIRDLIKDCRVKEETAVKLLTNFPFYIRHPSEELLTECEALLTLDDEKCEKIKHTAVLSFSNLLFITCPHNCSPAKYEFYIRRFVDLFSSSRTYEEQLLYLEALNNIELGNSFEHIVPIIKGNVTTLTAEPHHIRFLGVWATMNQAPYHPVEVYYLYWPILANRAEHLEMRIAAFTMLVISGASPGRFLSLFWFMQSETNVHLKNFYYTTIRSLVDSQFPCYSYMKPLASLLVQYVSPPTKQNWYTGNYIIDYTDPKHGYGGLAQLFTVANERTGGPNVFYLQLINHAMGRVINNIAVYMKLEGVEESLKKELINVDPNTLTFSKFSQLMKKLKPSSDVQKPVHIEIIVKNHGRVIFCKHINDTTFHNQLDSWLQILRSVYPSWLSGSHEKFEDWSKEGFFNPEFHINYQNADAPVFLQSIQPTDLGTPAFFNLDSATLLSFRGNFTKDGKTTFLRRNQLDLWYSATLRGSITTYNPISNLWHKVRRYLTYQLHVPINSWFSFSPSQGTFRLGIIKPAGMVASAVIHIRRVTVIQGSNSEHKLKLSCPKCNVIEDVTNNLGNNGQESLISIDDNTVGVKVQGNLHHCENITFPNLWKLIGSTRSTEKNFQLFTLSGPVVSMISFINDIVYLSTQTCGVRAELLSIHDRDTEFEISSRVTKEKPKGSADSKTVLRLTLANKFTEGHDSNITIINQWDINSALEHYPQNSKYELKIKLTLTVMEKKVERLCVDGGIATPVNEEHRLLNVQPSGPINGYLNVYWGPFDGPKCPKNGILKITAKGELLEEQRQEATSLDAWPHNKCFAEKKESAAEWGKQTPLTEACYRSSVAAGTLRKYTITLKHLNVSKESSDLGSKVLSAFVTGSRATPQVNDSPITAILEVPDGPEPHIRISMNGKDGVIRDVKYLIEPWLINTHFPLAEQIGMKFGLINSCVIKPDIISTFDNATNNYSASQCYTLAAGDCSPEHRFAVFVKKVPGSKPLAVKIYTGGNYAEIVPSLNGDININVNGESVPSGTVHYFYPPDESNSEFEITQHQNGLVEVNSKLTTAWLHYNGYFMVIGVTGIYNGQTCGLCGDLNGDPSNDISEVLSVSCN